MNKFVKCWVFIICLLFIFLILFTDSVNAESCNNNYISNFAGKYKGQTLNLGSNEVDITTDLITLDSNYNTYYFYLYNAITTTSGVNYSSIDYQSTCTHQSSYWTSPSANQPYIRYADGTTANIVNYQEFANICDTYNNSGTITSPVSYEPNISNINVVLRNSNTGYQVVCEYNKDNGIAKCPYISSFNLIRFQVSLEKANTTGFKAGILSGFYKSCVSDSQQIINNNNSNTQNIINNQNQNSDREYNFISNSTIDSSTTSDVNNIDVSNSDTKLAVTNFALIPLNFMQSIINSFSSSCSQVCIGNCGSGHDNDWRFVFPCLDFESILGSNLYAIIDSLFAFGMVFAFIRSVRKFFINALLLTTDASSEVGVFL